MVAERSFDRVCQRLATVGGGFTLWLGAGASVAATRATLPTWHALVADLSATPTDGDFPDRLERLSQELTHAEFRKQLRLRLLGSVDVSSFDCDNLVQQAVIAARAGALVSFNIEFLSAAALCLLRGGENFLPRTLEERSPFGVDVTSDTRPGIVGSPIYFPHGLLLKGNTVLTKSEYDRHCASFAMATAVHLCIGADLLILGMSLDDSYLRDAILQNRRWIRDVLWIGERDRFRHTEWARVAHVTCVDAPNADVWSRLNSAILDSDEGEKTLTKWAEGRRGQLTGFINSVLEHRDSFPVRLQTKAQTLLAEGACPMAKAAMLADFCVATGHDVPSDLAQYLADNEE